MITDDSPDHGPESQTQIRDSAKKDFHCRITDEIVI